MEKQIPSQEQEYLNTVLSVIDKKLGIVKEQEADNKEELVKAQEDMWGDITHVIRDFDDMVEVNNSATFVAEVNNRVTRSSDEIKKLQKMKDVPYFGRFDFHESGESVPETIYIGAGSLTDEATYTMYVCDWRAPICSAFYEFDLGEGNYETPEGLRKIDIFLKRQYKIENGKLLYLYDTDSAVHDEILGQILSKNTGNKLKVIISSIQKEQNAVIRNAQTRYLLIYGLAGSGKTSVGMHRLAYLLYHHRDTLKSHNIVVISNNAVFDSYIANILPDLGENDVNHIVFHHLLTKNLPSGIHFESYYTQLSILAQDFASPRAQAAKIKSSEEFLHFTLEYFNTITLIVPELRYKDKVIVTKQALQAVWDGRRYTYFKETVDNLNELIRRYYEDYFLIHHDEILRDIDRSTEEHISEWELRFRYERMRERLIQEAANEVARLNAIDPFKQLKKVMQLYADKKHLTGELRTEFTQSLAAQVLFFEDAVLLFLYRVLMGEVESNPDVSHVLVDEAQDYSAVQLYLIKLLYPKSYFTLLADVFQTINDISSTSRYEGFGQAFGSELQAVRLHRCYRSSGPINALAFQLIGKHNSALIKQFSYFKRGGKLPQYIESANPAQTIAKIAATLKGYHTIGIVTGNVEESVTLHEKLKGSLTAQLIDGPFNEIKERIVILPLHLAKGLEFDAVLLHGCILDSGNDERDRQRAYLACTRALHELYIVENRQLPLCFSDCMPFIENTSLDKEE